MTEGFGRVSGTTRARHSDWFPWVLLALVIECVSLDLSVSICKTRTKLKAHSSLNVGNAMKSPVGFFGWDPKVLPWPQINLTHFSFLLQPPQCSGSSPPPVLFGNGCPHFKGAPWSMEPLRDQEREFWPGEQLHNSFREDGNSPSLKDLWPNVLHLLWLAPKCQSSSGYLNLPEEGKDGRYISPRIVHTNRPAVNW